MTKSSPPKVASRKARTAKPSSKTRRNKPRKVAAENVRVDRATARNDSADKVRDNAAALLDQSPNMHVPNTFRALAEQNVAHTRELYEKSKDTLQAVLQSWHTSFGAAGQGAATLNRQFLDLAERNINTGFDLATGLAGARDFGEVMELQANYWRKMLGELHVQGDQRGAKSSARPSGRNQ